MASRYAALLASAALTGCSLAPDFALPEISMPAMFKEAKAPEAVPLPAEIPGQWAQAQMLEKADRGAWWTAFGDAALNELEAKAQAANPSLAAARARVTQARAVVRANAQTFFPELSLGANAYRAKPSGAAAAGFGGPSGLPLKPYNLYEVTGTAQYEADLFGRVRDNERALAADADALEAAYRSVLLALQADVAQLYFSLRALDAERELLRDTVAIREEAARIMQRRYELGAVGEQDHARTAAELAATRAELLILDRRRGASEHALAVLLGEAPGGFAFAEAPLAGMPPEIPAGLPSTLLERRPDVASATSQMAAANARVGVARTAFFPRLILTATGGFSANTVGELFQWSTHTWALGQLAGSALSMTLFDSGRNAARLDAAKGAYEEAVGNYRAQVLMAFRDVEDALLDQRLLATQSAELNAAAQAAARATELTYLRYNAGEIAYFEVVDAQRNSLTASRAAVQAYGQRFIATVALIRALGGGWDVPVAAPAASVP